MGRIVTYVLSVIPLKEWNKITVITSEQQLNELMDTTYNSGKTTLTVRYEPGMEKCGLVQKNIYLVKMAERNIMVVKLSIPLLKSWVYKRCLRIIFSFSFACDLDCVQNYRWK